MPRSQPVEQLSSERRSGEIAASPSNFFQASNRQTIGGAKRLFVVLPMKSAIGSPAPQSLSIGRKMPRVADKTKRGKRTEPLKPFQRTSGESQLPFRCGQDQHIGPSRPISTRGDDASTCLQLAWMEKRWKGRSFGNRRPAPPLPWQAKGVRPVRAEPPKNSTGVHTAESAHGGVPGVSGPVALAASALAPPERKQPFAVPLLQ